MPWSSMVIWNLNNTHQSDKAKKTQKRKNDAKVKRYDHVLEWVEYVPNKSSRYRSIHCLSFIYLLTPMMATTSVVGSTRLFGNWTNGAKFDLVASIIFAFFYNFFILDWKECFTLIWSNFFHLLTYRIFWVHKCVHMSAYKLLQYIAQTIPRHSTCTTQVKITSKNFVVNNIGTFETTVVDNLIICRLNL